jgi:hypothetical protein
MFLVIPIPNAAGAFLRRVFLPARVTVRYATYGGWTAPGLATTHTFSNKTS